MYKVTKYGKTVVGCNEDAWRTSPRIWFETAGSNTKYGAAFTGSRFDGSNGFAPQSGMNPDFLSPDWLRLRRSEKQMVKKRRF
jgi:hypothetical protein